MTYTIGSFCTGYGGAELAVEAVLGPAEHLWHAEYDPKCDPAHPLYKKNNGHSDDPLWKGPILSAHWPGTPNLGDIARVDWSTVARPDVVTAGFPCTDISAAGRMAGLGTGTRSGVWGSIAAALAVLRPRLVLIENVRALLSTDAQRNTDGADRDVEPGPADLGDGPTGPVLRALGAVLGDLADLGFDAEWQVVAASDVGACHRRERVFILAWPADSEGVGQWHRRAQGRPGVPAAAVAGGAGTDGVSLLPTPTAADTTGAGHANDGGMNLRTAVTLLPTPNAALGRGTGTPSAATAQDRIDSGRRFVDDAVALLPTPTARDFKGTGPADADRNSPNLSAMWALLPTPTARDGDGRGEGSPEYWENRRTNGWDKGVPLGAAINLLPTPTATSYGNNQSDSPNAAIRPSLDSLASMDRWGQYAPAIARWEQVVGRPAPEPTEPGSKGQPRLSPRFVEFLMGLPAGWVTDHVGRNPALHALGDGVVWQQGAHALRLLLDSAVVPERLAA